MLESTIELSSEYVGTFSEGSSGLTTDKYKISIVDLKKQRELWKTFVPDPLDINFDIVRSKKKIFGAYSFKGEEFIPPYETPRQAWLIDAEYPEPILIGAPDYSNKYVECGYGPVAFSPTGKYLFCPIRIYTYSTLDLYELYDEDFINEIIVDSVESYYDKAKSESKEEPNINLDILDNKTELSQIALPYKFEEISEPFWSSREDQIFFYAINDSTKALICVNVKAREPIIIISQKNYNYGDLSITLILALKGNIIFEINNNIYSFSIDTNQSKTLTQGQAFIVYDNQLYVVDGRYIKIYSSKLQSIKIVEMLEVAVFK